MPRGMKPTSGAKVIASGAAQREMPPRGPNAHEPKTHTPSVGETKRMAVPAAQQSHPGEGMSMKSAVRELASQHPQKPEDLGPHHGSTEHVRHERLGGMSPSKGSSY